MRGAGVVSVFQLEVDLYVEGFESNMYLQLMQVHVGDFCTNAYLGCVQTVNTSFICNRNHPFSTPAVSRVAMESIWISILTKIF